jgi:hypothetical protein
MSPERGNLALLPNDINMTHTSTAIATPSDVLVSSVVLEFCARGWNDLAAEIASDYLGLDIFESGSEDFSQEIDALHETFWTKTMSLVEMRSCISMHYREIFGGDYDGLFEWHAKNIIKRSEIAKKNNAVIFRKPVF